ncbi:sugar ABC transporter ATP-binding protein [Pediococcus siamensis]|uniref:sugar ABC transporter ATP-binding protein n=1 Tax=Pediococcus siamensis TaxID=381829 RepID=UPI0039A3C475
MTDIQKAFGSTLVLDKVSLSLAKGTIHALLGENGTGKSTLMNILSGNLSKDSGQIYLNGKLINPQKNKQITKLITFVHQELSLVDELTVFENLFLGHELNEHGFLNKNKMIAESRRVLNLMGFKVDPRLKVKELNQSEKQMVEIGRGLINDAKIIIMDEPTSALDDMEIKALFKVMKKMKKNGITIVFITHKLNEVFKVCDSYTVMRNGHVIESGEISEKITEQKISGLMVGRKLTAMTKSERKFHGRTILGLERLSKGNQFRDITMHIDSGEIVGVTGLLGDGRSELFQTVAGANGSYQGVIKLANHTVKINSTQTALRHRIAYIPKDRKDNGIIKDLNVEDNTLLTVFNKISRWGFIRKKLKAKKLSQLLKKIDVKFGQSRDSIETLSGGNQQKVLVARALSRQPQLVIFDNPTQGVDVGAKAEIYQYIQDLANQGVAFVILSNEFAELNLLCDRVYVMYQGKVVYEVAHDNLNEKDLMLYATGS